MYYVKAKIADGVTIRTEINDENVFNICPKCGVECAVELASIAAHEDFDWCGSSTYCDECAHAFQRERLQSERRAEVRDAGYFDNVTTAMAALRRVWGADQIDPKERLLRLQKAFAEILPELPPEAFLDGEDHHK